MGNIERSLFKDIFQFVIVNSEFYSSLEDYIPKSEKYQSFLKNFLPDDWYVAEPKGYWCMAHPPKLEIPDQGFKIHVSSDVDSAPAILKAVLPILVSEEAAFKILTDDMMHYVANSREQSRGASGKFITVYPQDIEHFKRLMEKLHEATQAFDGPYILSDRPYKGSNILFYRYGSFKNIYRVNVYGEKELLIKDSQGNYVPDDRQPIFQLPEGVEDPFGAPPSYPENITLMNRFKPEAIMAASSKGCVYKGKDMETGRDVVIKEARPFIGKNEKNPHDAVEGLRNEHRALERLKDTGATPKPISCFQEWKHHFLVTEMLPGFPLFSFPAVMDFNVLLKSNASVDDTRHFCDTLATIYDNLLDALQVIHDCGVVIGDLAPQNILIDKDTLEVTFIDLESAHFIDDPQRAYVPMGTPGFATKNIWAGKRPTKEDDLWGLWHVFFNTFFPLQTFFSRDEKAKTAFLEHVVNEKGLPGVLNKLGRMEVPIKPQKMRAFIRNLKSEADNAADRQCLYGKASPQAIGYVVEAIADHILSIGHYTSDGLFPTDYRSFYTNKLSVAYGAAGVMHFLNQQLERIPDKLSNRFYRLCREVDVSHLSPSLYVGSSGIAWILLDLGFVDLAEQIIRRTLKSPLLDKSLDLFYGAAGWGLACLRFFEKTKSDFYRDQALKAASLIEESVLSEDGGDSFINIDRQVHFGLAHGACGPSLFFLKLHQATGDASYLEAAKRLLNHDLSKATEVDGFMAWPRAASDHRIFPYWRHGSAGIGMTLVRFYNALKDKTYLENAVQASHFVRSLYTVMPNQFSGLAGIGEFLADLFQATGDRQFEEAARAVASKVLLFAKSAKTGLVFPGEELMRSSTDYGTGSAGVGSFLLRTISERKTLFLD